MSQDESIRDGGAQRAMLSSYKSVVVLLLAVYPAVVIGMTSLRPKVGDLPIAIQALLLTLLRHPARRLGSHPLRPAQAELVAAAVTLPRVVIRSSA